MNIPRNVEPNENHIWGALPSYSERPPINKPIKTMGMVVLWQVQTFQHRIIILFSKFNVKNK
jgi:hypothetical protein